MGLLRGRPERPNESEPTVITMTENDTQQSGNSKRRTDNKASESTTADDPAVEDLAAENRALRERVDELETALAEIHDRLDDSTAQDDSTDSTAQAR